MFLKRVLVIVNLLFISVFLLASLVGAGYSYENNILRSKGLGSIASESFEFKKVEFGNGKALPLGSDKLLVKISYNNIFFHQHQEFNFTQEGSISYQLIGEKRVIYPNMGFYFAIFFIFLITNFRHRYFFFLILLVSSLILTLFMVSIESKPFPLFEKSSLTKIPKLLSSYAQANKEKDFNLMEGCHGELHKLGAKYYKYGYTLDEIIADSNATICAGGFIHGATEEAGRSVESIIELENIIDKVCLGVDKKLHDPLWLDNCLHSAGHSFFYFENGVLLSAINDCKYFTDPKVRYACSKGAFMSFANTLYSKEGDMELKRNNLIKEDGIALCDKFTESIFCEELIYNYLSSGDMSRLGGHLTACKDLEHADECRFGIGVVAYQSYRYAGEKNSLEYLSACKENLFCYEGFLHAEALDFRFKGKEIDDGICRVTPSISMENCRVIYRNAYNFDPPVLVKQ